MDVERKKRKKEDQSILAKKTKEREAKTMHGTKKKHLAKKKTSSRNMSPLASKMLIHYPDERPKENQRQSKQNVNVT
jgi:hypothetical protein